jgi:hypothetical protein
VIYVWCLVILVTSAVVMVAVAWWLGRGQPAQVPVARLADPEPLPWERWYGPFPADTAPLLLLSESAAALVALEREITQMIADAERKTRWLR